MDIYPHIILIDQHGLARMDSDADLQAHVFCPCFPSQSLLGFYRGSDGICCARENSEERVTMRAYFTPIPFCKGLTQDALVLFQNVNVISAQTLNKLCRAADITEK